MDGTGSSTRRAGRAESVARRVVLVREGERKGGLCSGLRIVAP